jgi:hypothetical protein
LTIKKSINSNEKKASNKEMQKTKDFIKEITRIKIKKVVKKKSTKTKENEKKSNL